MEQDQLQFEVRFNNLSRVFWCPRHQTVSVMKREILQSFPGVALEPPENYVLCLDENASFSSFPLKLQLLAKPTNSRWKEGIVSSDQSIEQPKIQKTFLKDQKRCSTNIKKPLSYKFLSSSPRFPSQKHFRQLLTILAENNDDKSFDNKIGFYRQKHATKQDQKTSFADQFPALDIPVFIEPQPENKPRRHESLLRLSARQRFFSSVSPSTHIPKLLSNPTFSSEIKSDRPRPRRCKSLQFLHSWDFMPQIPVKETPPKTPEITKITNEFNTVRNEEDPEVGDLAQQTAEDMTQEFSEMKVEIPQTSSPLPLERTKTVVENVLRNPHLFAAFSAFMKSRVSEENILFYEAVEKYQQIPRESKELRDEAQRIWNLFFESQAKFEINVSQEVKKAIRLKANAEEGWRDATPDLFYEAQQLIIIMLSTDHIVKFKASRFYKDTLKIAAENVKHLSDVETVTEEDDEELLRDVDESSGEKIIVGGSLVKLLDQFASRSIPDKEFIDVFLGTFRYVITGNSLIEELEKRYLKYCTEKIEGNNTDQLVHWSNVIEIRLLNIIKRWITRQFYDFEEEKNLFVSLVGFIKSLDVSSRPVSVRWGHSVNDFLKKKIFSLVPESSFLVYDLVEIYRGFVGVKSGSEIVDWVFNNAPPNLRLRSRSEAVELASKWLANKRLRPLSITCTCKNLAQFEDNSLVYYHFMPILPERPETSLEIKTKKDKSGLSFLRIHPVMLAHQLTLIVHELYKQITPIEILQCNWKGPKRELQAPNIVAIIEWFNKINQWAIALLVKTPNSKKRVTVLSRLIQVVHECVKVNNFDTSMAILMALQCPNVLRLKQTWRALSNKDMSCLKAMISLFNVENHFQPYRVKLEKTPPPAMPYIGLFLQDLYSLNELPTYMDQQKVKKMLADRRKLCMKIQNASAAANASASCISHLFNKKIHLSASLPNVPTKVGSNTAGANMGFASAPPSSSPSSSCHSSASPSPSSSSPPMQRLQHASLVNITTPPNLNEVNIPQIVNLRKLRRIAHTVKLALRYQTVSYSFVKDTSVCHFLHSVHTLSEAELVRFSHLCEASVDK